MTFADNLKAVLADRNLKQADLCRMTGIPSSLISDYFNDVRKPGFDHLFNIARALNLTVDELVIYADKAKAPGYDPTLEELKDKFNYLIRFVPDHMRQPLMDMVEASAVKQEPPQ
jgi:transcriptional regulator with XRE-family HTH domain